MKFKFIDLFAGLGGFHLAMESLGGECVFASELKEDLRRLYTMNYPGARIEGDITKIDPQSIPDHDVLCAGFPCQPFSVAGKRQGFNDIKGRGNLFDYICGIVEAKRPRFIMLENVAHLKGHDNGNTWLVIKGKLEALNYCVQDEIFSPHQFGIPQHRKRIYIVCEDLDRGHLEHFHFPTPSKDVPCSINSIIDWDAKNVTKIPPERRRLINTWDEFIMHFINRGLPVPRNIWAHEFGATYDLDPAPQFQTLEQLQGKRGAFGQPVTGSTKEECLACLPKYAREYAGKNIAGLHREYIEASRKTYAENKEWLDAWKPKLYEFQYSRQKFEWRCSGGNVKSPEELIVQIRQSGVRYKMPNYSVALTLNISQTPIFPWVPLPKDELEPGEPDKGRYMTLLEAQRIQGMQSLNLAPLTPATRRWEALGNAVNVDVVRNIAQSLVKPLMD